MKSIEQQIAAIVSRATMTSPRAITARTKLSELGINSLDYIECVISVEETFQIEIDPQSLWQLETVQDFVSAVKAAVAARSR